MGPHASQRSIFAGQLRLSPTGVRSIDFVPICPGLRNRQIVHFFCAVCSLSLVSISFTGTLSTGGFGLPKGPRERYEHPSHRVEARVTPPTSACQRQCLGLMEHQSVEVSVAHGPGPSDGAGCRVQIPQLQVTFCLTSCSGKHRRLLKKGYLDLNARSHRTIFWDT